METTVFYSLMLQKYVNLKQKTLKYNLIRYVQEEFQKILPSVTWKKTGLNGYVHNNSADYNVIDNSKYLMKIHDIE